MPQYLLLVVFFTIISLPSALQAIGMGDFVDEVYLQTEVVGRVLFTHNVHGTDCMACHPAVFKKKSNSNHASMQEMEQGKSCGACHNGNKVFSVAGNCLTCHKVGEIFYKDKENGDVVFQHSVHIEMFGCTECHPDIFKAERGANKATMEAMEKGEFCGACHDGSAAFSVAEDCESCHKM